MGTYEIPIRITLAMQVVVEADSLEEAQEKAAKYMLSNRLVAVDDDEMSQCCVFEQRTVLDIGKYYQLRAIKVAEAKGLTLDEYYQKVDEKHHLKEVK